MRPPVWHLPSASRRLVTREETEAGHASEVLVERPDRRTALCGEGTDQQIGEAEPLAGRPGDVDPLVDELPGTALREEERKCGQRPAQRQTNQPDVCSIVKGDPNHGSAGRHVAD